MEYIAHRGMVYDGIVENTIGAFNSAVSSSFFSGFELDLRLSKDKKYVIYHDPIINGKLLKNISFKELSKYGICSLDEVLDIDTNKKIFIEIKDFSIDVNLLTKYLNNYGNNIYVMSFSYGVIDKFKDLNRNFKIGVLDFGLNMNNKKYDFVCLLYTLVNYDEINYYKKNNTEVYLYGINKMSNIFKYDVGYILDYDCVKNKKNNNYVIK